MKYIAQIALFAMASLMLTACNDTIVLRSAQSDMPILIKGNADSDVVILFLHGGPGNGSKVYEHHGFFSGIEETYQIAYWDQRAGGGATGNATVESLSVEQFLEDMDKAIALLRELYPGKEIAMMGHSWGCGIGKAYLIEKSGENYNDLLAWIDIDGTADVQMQVDLATEFALEYAEAQISNGNEVEYWQEAVTWYAETPREEVGRIPYVKHYEYLTRAGAYWYGEEFPLPGVSYILSWETQVVGALESLFFSLDNIDFRELEPYADRMDEISLPTLILWGRHDKALAVETGQFVFEAITTPAEDKKMVIFEASGHSPMIEEQDAFNEAVVNFLDGL